MSKQTQQQQQMLERARASAGQLAGGESAYTALARFIKNNEAAIRQACGRDINPTKLIRVALTEIRRNPELLKCSPQSLYGALLLSAQLGLEFGPLGEAYMVPFWNATLGRNEVQFIPGYRGLIRLARRSGEIQSISARTVYEGDEFEYEYGLNERLVHRPARENRGQPIYWYLVVRFRDGGHYFVVLDREEVESHRLRSPGQKSGPAGAWATDYNAMALKTCVRVAAPWLPLTIEAARALEADGQVISGVEMIQADGEAIPQIEMRHEDEEQQTVISAEAPSEQTQS